MTEEKIILNLYRAEFSKIVAVLCNTYGMTNIQLAEDIASETFLVATETWSMKGIPDHPKAWLYGVAKNKTKDYFKRAKLYNAKILPVLASSDNVTEQTEIDLSPKNIEDGQLRMLLHVCNPLLTAEAQITLALRVLCSFSIDEIASALLTSKSTINKRLLRAKQSYRKHDIKLGSTTPAELKDRHENVLAVIYLLFNEGYYSSTAEESIRKHLCLEAMRLLYLFLRHYNIPQANALMALFCFHSSRFEAREDEFGNAVLYENQDTEKWSKELILIGETYLQLSAKGDVVSKCHLEASIAYWHTRAEGIPDKWENILQLYNSLLQIEYSPIAALNRTYALSRARTKPEALIEALKIDLNTHHLYHTLLAELYHGTDLQKELEHLRLALRLVKTTSDRKVIEMKMENTGRGYE